MNLFGNILSLFDLTGSWSGPYRRAGYDVTQIDIQSGTDIMTWDYRKYPRDHFGGILAAIPCTDFALSGASYFKAKDRDGRTYESMALMYKTLAIVQYFSPGLRWWVVENPMSRIHKLCPELGKIELKFSPYEFAGWLRDPEPEQYQKTTWLWGDFQKPQLMPKPKLVDGSSWTAKVGGKSVKTKNQRSKTPEGFAYAFYLANP